MKRSVKIGGVLHEVLTLGELATLLNRKTITLRKFEERGLLPRANFRLPGQKRQGARIYTRKLCEEIKVIFEDVSQGVKVTEEQKSQLRAAFQRERDILKQ